MSKIVKKRVNRKGILQLADSLIANAKLYDQLVYGVKKACGTERCMAGNCLVEKIGVREFNKKIKKYREDSYFDAGNFPEECIQAGKKQLGINEGINSPVIFEDYRKWPEDLLDSYQAAETPIQKVVVALKALSRLLPSGDIDTKVHTRIPQLTALLKDQKAPAKKGKK